MCVYVCVCAVLFFFHSKICANMNVVHRSVNSHEFHHVDHVGVSDGMITGSL